jgi:predicted RNase H-like HicB family nuclease
VKIRTALVGLVLTMSAAYAGATGKPEDPERDPNPPATLSDALDRLSRMLSPATIREMSDGSELDMAKYHFSVGLWMRNYWGLWAQGPLHRHLAALGLRHPDDMSGLILTCYWRRLHGNPHGVEEQVARYEEYWRLTTLAWWTEPTRERILEAMRTFNMVVERDPDTGLFVGYVPGWAGAHSQGDSLDELQRNLQEVIGMLLEDGEPRLESEFVGVQTIKVA